MSISFETNNLKVEEVAADLCPSEKLVILPRIVALFTPAVVANLPSDFQDICTEPKAEAWLKTMLVESRLLSIKHKELGLVVGFLFAHQEHEGVAHIGYLLGEEFWGQGYATEFLNGFIEELKGDTTWRKLVAGVEASNKASSRLLQKIGFRVQGATSMQPVVFYEYDLS